MMREIKFRVFGKENEMMINWNELLEAEDITEMLSHGHEEDGYYSALMQYTGLEDKNGVEIYEGDILLYLDSYDRSTESGYDFEEFHNVGQIVFDNQKARFDITNKSDIDYDDWIETISDCKVIGNIFEHPHLLEDNP